MSVHFFFVRYKTRSVGRTCLFNALRHSRIILVRQRFSLSCKEAKYVGTFFVYDICTLCRTTRCQKLLCISLVKVRQSRGREGRAPKNRPACHLAVYSREGLVLLPGWEDVGVEASASHCATHSAYDTMHGYKPPGPLLLFPSWSIM